MAPAGLDVQRFGLFLNTKPQIMRALVRQKAQKYLRMFFLTFASLALLFLYLCYLLFRVTELYDQAIARIRRGQMAEDGILTAPNF
jgi:hypothetical protein